MEKEIPGIYQTYLSPTYPATAIEIEIEKQFKCRQKSKKKAKIKPNSKVGAAVACNARLGMLHHRVLLLLLLLLLPWGAFYFFIMYETIKFN